MSVLRVDVIDKDYAPTQVREPLSVCMTILNEVRTIQQTLRDLLNQTVPPDEIVIVDAGSTDGTRAAIMSMRDYRIKVLEVPCPRGEGRNLASRVAKHDVQVTADAGCRYGQTFLANIVGPLLGGVDISAGIYQAIIPTRWSRYFIPDWKNLSYLQNKFYPSGRAMAIRKSVFERLGRYPEKLKQDSGEDTLFGIRAKRKCRRWVINRKAIVEWNAPITIEQATALAYHYGVGNGLIGCSEYEPNALTSDAVMKSSLRGYRAGCALRENPTSCD
jgi:glycosyltransferase involved in cell wall biosynthesis